jgi:hypothetical protein
MKIEIYDVKTGEMSTRDLTPEEIAELPEVTDEAIIADNTALPSPE